MFFHLLWVPNNKGLHPLHNKPSLSCRESQYHSSDHMLNQLNRLKSVCVCVCVPIMKYFNRFLVETNWCSYSYILYNVYQTKTNTASNLKRIKRKKKKRKTWKLSNPLACGAEDVKTRGSGDWRGHSRCCGCPITSHFPPSSSGRQRMEGAGVGGRDKGGMGGSEKSKLGRG